MDQPAIFGPVFALMGLTFLVWVHMFAVRIHFLRTSGIDPQDPEVVARFTAPPLANPSDNFKNLFELPVLFYALCLYLFVTNQVDGVYLASAWVFVGFRVLHSAVHCTVNRVTPRFALYALSSLALWFSLARAALGIGGAAG